MKSILKFKMNGQNHSIRVSQHGNDRQKQRSVANKNIIDTIASLGKKKLLELKSTEKDIMIVNKKENHTIIIGIKKNTYHVITTINKSENVFVKANTKVITI